MPREPNEIDLKIIELYKQGVITREIGLAVGRSKNSICGLLSRFREWGYLGPAVKRDKTVDARKVIPKRVIGTRPSPVKLRHFKEMRSIHSKIDAYQLPLNLPNMNGISFWDLKNSSCRYIVAGGNGRPHMYCGEAKEHKSYCLYHASICYMPNIKK